MYVVVWSNGDIIFAVILQNIFSKIKKRILICFTTCVNFFVSKWKSGKQAGKRCIVTFCNTIFLLTSHLNFTILEKLPFSYVMILRQAVNCHSTSLNYSISVLAILSRALFLFAFRFRSRLALNYLPWKWLIFLFYM